MSAAVQLERAPDAMHSGGTVAYRVLLADGTSAGRWIGWVGDGRAWRGWRYGTRQWWACWREHGDTAARWSTDLTYPTSTAAVADLLAHITPAGGAR